VKELLSQPDVRPNACRAVGVTSRFGTASAGWEAVAELLVCHPDIDMNATTDNRNTALFHATKNSRCRLFETFIVLQDSDLTIVGGGGKLLHSGVQHTDFLCAARKPMIDVPATNHHKETILHRAVTA
jgi:hypothetical protein